MDHYGTPQGLRDYCTLRGIALPADMLDDEEAEIALRVGSEFVDYGYSDLFGGTKTGERAQVREWPRRQAYDVDQYLIGENTIPREIESATYEAAAIHARNPGSLSVDYTPSKYRSVSVDGAVSVEFAQFNDAIEAQPQYLAIRRALGPILTRYPRGSAISGVSFRA